MTDKQVKTYILTLVKGEASAYGYRKLTSCLRRDYDLIINKKKVYRLYKELDILIPQREVKEKAPRHLAKNRRVTGPNQLCQVDIKYGSVRSSRRFFFLAIAIDVYDRSIVGYYHGHVCEGSHIVSMLEQALQNRGLNDGEKNLIIRSDNGPQFCGWAFHRFCEERGLGEYRLNRPI
ncbi:DDE-type integrase/transposase/recombinase [Halobacillus amylolyticus]|uniref:DDE-type integrase/transposase/recombinase n=1 Tax=Halobacillus amylolyticus TaxID=2932259 RepID=A0ABY4H812_9BACI|nr:DDE-type integrase/transposase/recombinase [Halobacillus amylolyticus]UOR11001.1 DDE-type integrase/transposase/recombinase [Halobacillus amylolyticus]